MSDAFDPYQEWLGIPPPEQPPHHYRLLGVRVFENDAEAIDQAVDQRMAQLRAAQIGRRAAESQRLLNEVAAARACLINPRLRAEYDAMLKQRCGEQPIAGPPPGEMENFEQLSGDLAPLPELQPTDPIYGMPLPAAQAPIAGYPVAAPAKTAQCAPSSRRTRVHPLIWVFGAVGLSAVALFLGVLIFVAHSLSSRARTPESEAVASRDKTPRPDDSRPVPDPAPPTPRPTPPRPTPPRPTPPRPSPASIVPTKPEDPPSDSNEKNPGGDVIVAYTFEPETFTEEDGKLILRDFSGNGFNGVIQGKPQPQLVPDGKHGAALHFAGRDGRVVIPGLRNELVKNRTKFTVAAWVNLEPDQKETNQKEEGSLGIVFDVGWGASECITLGLPNERFRFTLANRQGGHSLDAPWDYRRGWRHLAGVWDGKEQRFYVDGRLAAREATTLKSLNRSTLSSDEAKLGITAKSYKAADRYYHGELDELVVFSRALSEAEIGELMNRGIENAAFDGRAPVVASSPQEAPPSPSAETPEEPPRGTEVIELISLVDLSQDARPVKRWAMNNGLPEVVDGFARPKLVFPYEPPTEYDVEVVFSKPKRDFHNSVALIMPGRDNSFFWNVGKNAQFSVSATPNPTLTPLEPGIQLNRMYTTMVQVRRDGVRGFLDGKLIVEYETDFSDMKFTSSYFRIPEKKQIAVDADSRTIFHSIKLKEISGPGRFTRPR